MIKPPSIVRFERFWWASAVSSLVATVLAWDRTRSGIAGKFAADPRLRNDETAAVVAEWVQPANLTIMLVWTALVWFLVARQASRTGRVMAVVSATISGVLLLILLGGLALGRTLHPLSQAGTAGAALLAVLAAAALFRDDARLWFGEHEVEEPA